MNSSFNNDLTRSKSFSVGDVKELFKRYDESIDCEFQGDGGENNQQNNEKEENKGKDELGSSTTVTFLPNNWEEV